MGRIRSMAAPLPMNPVRVSGHPVNPGTLIKRPESDAVGCAARGDPSQAIPQGSSGCGPSLRFGMTGCRCDVLQLLYASSQVRWMYSADRASASTDAPPLTLHSSVM